MTKERKILYGAVFALVAVLFVLGGLYDLNISNTIYQPDNFMAKIFESFGIFPPFVIVSATLWALYFSVDEKKKGAVPKKIALAFLSALPYVVYGYMASETYWTTLWVRVVVGLIAAALLTPMTYLVISRVKEENRKRTLLFLLFASIVCVISSLVSINVLKFIWGRPRYREMVAAGDLEFSAFTPWYKINGFTLSGHHSFPSGHTCSAANLFVFCAIPEVFPEKREKGKIIAFLTAFYTFIMAYSRVVLGAHFLSDVTGGFFIGFLTYAVARYFYFAKFGKAFTAESEEAEGEALSETIAEDETENAEEAAPFETEQNEEVASEEEPEIIKDAAAESIAESEEAEKDGE